MTKYVDPGEADPLPDIINDDDLDSLIFCTLPLHTKPQFAGL